METKEYEVVVIGAGSGGLTAAVGFTKVGKRVLLVEKAEMGGECTNSGCIPSKALLHHAKAYYHAKQVAGESPKTERFRAEAFSYVRSKIDEVLREEQPEDFAKLGIDVVKGEAKFRDKCSIAVDEQVYRYKTAVIATGSSPRLLSVPGLHEEDVLTNQNIFDLPDVPARTLIIGSGPIGMELGQALAMLGSEVTIATIDTELGKLEDPALRPLIAKQFAKLGITVLTDAHIEAVDEHTATLAIKDADGSTTAHTHVDFDNILLAIGRVPNLPEGLDSAGIQFDEQCILVDSQYRTSNKYVYAIGDVTQKLKFTHTADDAARAVVTRVASRGWLRVNRRKAVPKVTYTLPEIAQVGLSFATATRTYRSEEVMKVTVPLTQNDRAKTEDTTDEGLLVVVVRRLNGQILGASLIGPAAGEIISLFTLAIDEKISMWRLQKLIYAYPTYSLIVKKAGDQFLARQLADLNADLWRAFKRHSPKLIAAVFWIALLVLFQQYKAENDLSYQEMLLQLLNFFTSTMWGPLVYMVLYAIRPLIFFPATLLTALSGALFGFWWGIFYTILGENASANFAYWIGRYFGNDLKLEDTMVGNWVEALRKRPFEAVLFMRLFYVPFDLTNYGSGILKVPWLPYFLATLIGIMPGLTTFVALGAAVDIEEFQMSGLSFDAFDPKFLALSVGIFVVSIFLSRFLRRWKAEK